jgi:Protein of unknown function (DUF2971)
MHYFGSQRGSSVLYKYFPIERSDFLINRLLRFTQPGDFNDPFELHPSADLMSKADIAALPPASGHEEPDGRMRILTPEALQAMLTAFLPGLHKQMAQHANHEGSYVVDHNRAAQSTFDSKFGILCLSDTADSLLMWAHYAGNHGGFVVQFDETNPFFAASEFEGQLLGLTRVEYSTERPVVSYSTLNSPHLYYRKSHEWSHEREWRLIKPLTMASEVIAREGFPLHLYEVPHEAIKGVILGNALPHDGRVKLFEVLASNLAHATIFQTVLSKDLYALEIHPPLDGKVPPGALDGKICEAR